MANDTSRREQLNRRNTLQAGRARAAAAVAEIRKVETATGGAGRGGAISTTTYAWDGGYLVVTTTTRIPRDSL